MKKEKFILLLYKMPKIVKKKKKIIKLISRPLIILSESSVLDEIRYHIKFLEKRLIDLREKMIEERQKSTILFQ